jgi:anti-sigma B factor antagonist
MNGLKIAVERDNQVIWVRLSGDLDLQAADELQRTLREEEPAAEVIGVDLSSLSFMDSTGLRLILEANERARKEGRILILIAGPENVQRVFRVTGLEGRLNFDS